MRLFGFVCRNSIALGLTAALTLACIGADGRSPAGAEPVSKPLDLNRFMHQSADKPAGHATKKQHVLRRPVAKRQEQPTTTPPPEPAPLPVAAARTEAVQPDPPVRVVTSDELNEIDITGSVAPVASTPAETVEENSMQLVESSQFNEIDQKADDPRPAAVETAPPDRESSARRDHASGSRLQHAWAVLQGAFATIVAAIQ